MTWLLLLCLTQPFNDLAATVGGWYDLNPRVLLAVSRLESDFRPGAINPQSCAVGLMQVLPSTARWLGYQPEDLTQPVVGMDAGAAYLARLRLRYLEGGVHPEAALWFAVAAYRIGLAHVDDGRILAASTGQDPERWFGNVETAFLLKQDPRIKTRYGPCNAKAAVAYVRRVRELMEAMK